ncbi:hypothetical protein [Pararhizobium sp. DWP3-4]|uniref:hypothetical protein n=1 Tax=unclassified Pararhizobium TaxID=2643050 RepID=UPI003CE72B35
MIGREGELHEYDYCGFSLIVHSPPNTEIGGDVLLLLPGQASAHRLTRADSRHNTLLVTEQCDQLCVMCSQPPPKKQHSDLFDQFATAVTLAPNDSYVGISGGEPMLHKERLFTFLETSAALRPDVRFHILTNGSISNQATSRG